MNSTLTYPLSSHVAVGILLSLLVVFAISGNVLVCVAIWTERSLRRIGNLFLISLAVADLLLAALVMSFAVANDVMGYWAFGPRLCDTWVAFDVMCCTSSILHLCAVSLDRYLAIKDPLKYTGYSRKRFVLTAIASIWIVSALISFVPIELHLHQFDIPINTTLSQVATCALDLSPPYAVFSSCVSFYFPCVVMIALYAQLYRYARRHVASIKAMTVNLPLDGNITSPSEHKAAVTLGVIVGVFLICWVPFFCVNIVDAFCKTCIPKVVFQGLTWLGYCNSALNPVIYSTFNQEFRQAFRRILTGRRNLSSVNSHKYNADILENNAL